MSGGGDDDDDDDDDGKPTFLRAPPAPADPAAPKPPTPASTFSPAPVAKAKLTTADLIAGMAANPALRAAGIRLESADLLEPRRREARAAAARIAGWDRGTGWAGAWVEQALGGLRVTVPGSWRRDGDTPIWEVPGRAMVSVHMFSYELSAPPVAEYVRFVASTDRRGYEQAGIAEIDHPHAEAPPGSALELFEHAPAPLEWPVRHMRVAAWTATALLCLKLDTDGLVADDLGADFARTWRSLR